MKQRRTIEEYQQELAGMDEYKILSEIAQLRKRIRGIEILFDEAELFLKCAKKRLEYLDFINPENCIKRAKALEE